MYVCMYLCMYLSKVKWNKNIRNVSEIIFPLSVCLFYRVRGYGVLSSSGRAAGVTHWAFWGQFPRVSGIADSHRLSYSDFFWNLYFSGSHYCQFLFGFHYPLFPATQIQKDRWRGDRGMRGLTGQNGSYKLPIIQHREAKGLDKGGLTLFPWQKNPELGPVQLRWGCCLASRDSQPSSVLLARSIIFLYLNTNDWIEP